MPKRASLVVALVLAATLPAWSGGLETSADGRDVLEGSLEPATAWSLARAAASAASVRATAGSLGKVTLLLGPGVIAPGAIETEADASGRMRPATPEPYRTFAGTVAGVPGSVVRLTITQRWVSGFVAVGARVVWLEPDDYETPERTVFTEPATEEPSTLPAGTDIVLEPSHPASHGGDDVNVGFGNCILVRCGTLMARVVLDGDKYFRDAGVSTCASRQAEVLNAVDGIYALQGIDVDLQVVQTNCRTALDFGSSSSSPGVYLENVRRKWNDSCPQATCPDRSLVFVSVGFDFEGGTVGIAYRPGVCTRYEPDPAVVVNLTQHCSDGYSLAQMVASAGSNYSASLFLRTKLAAHEIGHSFNATHDAASGCNSETRNGDIMCASIQDAGPNRFSSANAAEIRNHAVRTLGTLL